MSNLILREEEFSFGILDKVPVPNEEECFLLYQIGRNPDDSMVIFNGGRYSSAKVRHGRYNRQVTLSMKEQFVSQSYRIIMDNQNFYFDVTVKISFILRDAKGYFFDERIDEEKIRQIIRETIKRNGGKWNIQQSYQIQDSLENEIAEKLGRYKSLKFQIIDIIVNPDEDASKMLQSNRNKEVGIHIYRNETDEKISKNEEDQKIFESEHKLKEMKMWEMAAFMKTFGSLGPVVDEYLKGNMVGTEFYGYFMKAKEDKLTILNQAVENDLISQEEALKKLSEILNDTKLQEINKIQPLAENVVNKEDEKELIKNEETDMPEQVSLTDGDYI